MDGGNKSSILKAVDAILKDNREDVIAKATPLFGQDRSGYGKGKILRALSKIQEDDREDVIATRLKTYEENTLPLRVYFKELNKYVEVDGSREADAVFSSLVD